jgi:hypothetical protein
MRQVVLVVLLLALALAGPTYKTCDDFVDAIIANISRGDFAKLPLPSIMYSGITSNNPGQKYECEHKSGPVPYNYYLVDWVNSTAAIETSSFTGLCVPQECNKQDIERKLYESNIKSATVYDYGN